MILSHAWLPITPLGQIILQPFPNPSWTFPPVFHHKVIGLLFDVPLLENHHFPQDSDQLDNSLIPVNHRLPSDQKVYRNACNNTRHHLVFLQPLCVHKKGNEPIQGFYPS